MLSNLECNLSQVDASAVDAPSADAPLADAPSVDAPAVDSEMDLENINFLIFLLEIYYGVICIKELDDKFQEYPMYLKKFFHPHDLLVLEEKTTVIRIRRTVNNTIQCKCGDLLKSLKKKKINISFWTLLIAAISSDINCLVNIATFNKLLNLTSNINSILNIGFCETPLILACRLGKINKISLLISAGANPNVRTSKTTPLIESSFRGSPACRFLVENGANLNARDEYGYTVFDRFGRHMCGKLKFSKSERKAIFKDLTLLFHQKNWERRWAFMQILFGHGFLKLIAKQQQDRENVQSLIDNNEKLEFISIKTPQEKHAFLLFQVWSNLHRMIMPYV